MKKKTYIVRAEMIEEVIMRHLEDEGANYNDMCQTVPVIQNYCAKHNCNCSLDFKCAKVTVKLPIPEEVHVSGLEPETIGIKLLGDQKLDLYEKSLKMYRNTLQKSEDLLRQKKRNLQDFYQFVLEELLGSKKSREMLLEVGDWSCEKTPVIKKCVYSGGNRDECIFCGEPEERK